MLYVGNPLYGVFERSPREDISSPSSSFSFFIPPLHRHTHTDTSVQLSRSVCFLFSPCVLTSFPIFALVLYLVFASMCFSLGLIFVFYPLLFAFTIGPYSYLCSFVCLLVLLSLHLLLIMRHMHDLLIYLLWSTDKVKRVSLSMPPYRRSRTMRQAESTNKIHKIISVFNGNDTHTTRDDLQDRKHAKNADVPTEVRYKIVKTYYKYCSPGRERIPRSMRPAMQEEMAQFNISKNCMYKVE